jgi:hypothetical protein
MLGLVRRESVVSAYHLLRYHNNGLDGELPVAVVEQILQAGSKEVNDQDVVQAFLAEVIDIRDPSWKTLARAVMRYSRYMDEVSTQWR